MLWASLTATVASLVLISWNISQKPWKNFARFVLMKVYQRHSRLWRWGLMVEAGMITKLLMSFVLRKALSEKWLLLIPRIRMAVAERRWQTVGNVARCLLKQANLPNSFWVRAVDVAFYLTNRCLSCSLPPNKTPFELFYGRKPDLSNLKVFGCSAFRFLEIGVKNWTLKLSEKYLLDMVALMITTICIIQLLVRLVIREMCHLTKRNFLVLEAVFQKTVSFFQNPRVL